MDAKLYLLIDKDWKPLADEFEKDYKTNDHIIVFNAHGKDTIQYAIVSLT